MTQFPTRIPPLPRAAWTEEARELFAFWGEPGARENGSASNLSMVLANHPPLATAYNIFGKHLLIASTVPIRPRELIVLRISWRLQADYEWHYHVGYALKAGMTLDEIAAVKAGPDAPNWTEQEAALLRAVDELLADNRIGDASWATLGKTFTTQQLMDIVFTAGNYIMLSWAVASFGVQLEDRVDKIDFDLKTETGANPATGERPGESKDWAANNAAKGKKA